MERMTMNRITTGFACAALVAAVLAAGCGKATSPTSSSASSAAGSGTSSTVAGIAYDAANTMQSSDSLALLPHGPNEFFGLPLGIPNGCAYDAGSQSFVCGPNTLRNGLTETHAYQFLDDTGAPQSAYDSVATASIHFTSHLSGTTTSAPWSTVDDARDLVESGLAGEETTRVWNGTGNAAHQDSVRLRDGNRILVTSTVNVVVSDVTVPVPRRPGAWPLSGTIATHLVASGGGQSIDQTSALAFNGTQFATLTVNGQTFTVDLARPPHGPPGGPCAGPPPRGPGGPGGPPPPGGGGHR